MSHYINKLPKNAVQIKNTLCWITPEGKLYGKETRVIPHKQDKSIKSPHKHYGKYFQYNTTVNKHNGYVYAPIKYIIDEKKRIYQTRQRRLHILVAETFIPNPNNLPIVGHKNNIKTDNRVKNLYWTTPKENTQKAVNDGLIVNDKGYEDSQPFPVVMFNTFTNEEIARYGSVREACRANPDISSSTILRQCKYKKPVRKPFYFRFQSDPSITPPDIVIQYDYFTDKEIGRYWNTWDASRKTGISSKTIGEQCRKGFKPKSKPKNNTYFLKTKAQ